MKQGIILLFSILLINVFWSQQFPKYLYGVASWYGEEFAGKKTASGVIYDPHLFTAAHRTLPFGTIIEVENLENGKKVQVTINDRGPFVDNRILDVSKKAAEELGFVQKGTAYVKVTVIRLGDENVSPTSFQSTNTSFYPSQTQKVVVTNYVTNQRTVTNYTNVNVSQAIVVPYEEIPLTQPKRSPSFILDEPEEIFVPVVPQKPTISPTPTTPALTPEKTISSPVSTEPQIIFSDLLLPEEKVIPLETRPITNHIPPRNLGQTTTDTNEKLYVTTQDILGPGEKYVIQVGAFTRQDNAIRLYQTLRNMGLPVFTSEINKDNTLFIRVRVGYYTSREEAQKVLNKLYTQKLNPVLLKMKP